MQIIVAIFALGYLAIALEHLIKVNKAAIAIMMAAIMWTVYAFIAPHNILEEQVIAQMGEVTPIIVFLLGAMTIVELVDLHGGFALVPHFIKAKQKKYLLWIIAAITFFMSSALDNMTSTIIMIAIMAKLVQEQEDRLWFASAIVIAANSGGAWSPIGDVTTIMLWIKGNVTTDALIPHLILPSVISAAIPVALITLKIRGNEPVSTQPTDLEIGKKLYPAITTTDRVIIICMGLVSLIMIPVFKSVTGLPPFMGILFALGLLWMATEIIYCKHKEIAESEQLRMCKVLKKIDTPTIFFFFGILMAVGVLAESGLLIQAAEGLDSYIGNTYIITGVIGVLSSIVDNVPLVAAAMGMYPIADPATVEMGTYAADFIQNGSFWELLAYCAGTGGSILIIGSVAGVVAMGAEKISFGWYLKNITLKALIGYLCGMLVYILIM